MWQTIRLCRGLSVQVTGRGPVCLLEYVHCYITSSGRIFSSIKCKSKSFVFVSNETRHDAKFILKKLILHVKLLAPNSTHCHFFSDPPTSQYRNKTIFMIIDHHKEYFCLQATCNYSEVGHSKGPCDPIGGTAKR